MDQVVKWVVDFYVDMNCMVGVIFVGDGWDVLVRFGNYLCEIVFCDFVLCVQLFDCRVSGY